MIQLQDVNKYYHGKLGESFALRDINLEVQPGEIFGVIGPSGAGKSTLVRCVNLLERPSSGKVLVAGKDLMTLNTKQLNQARHDIGMVFQHFNLLESRDVFGNVALPLELIHTDKKQIQERVTELLDLVGLADKRDFYPPQLSGGQKQRVAIARALATRPKVLLCDEMTSALDPETTVSILNLIKDINEQLNLTMLMITHEMDVIKRVADHVAVIDHGRIVELSDVVSIFKHPQHEVTQAFTQQVLRLELPHNIQSILHKQPVSGSGSLLLRVRFVGDAAAEPIIDALIREHDVNVNILQANLEFIRHDTIGFMLLALEGDQTRQVQAKQYLMNKKLDVEELGYVVADSAIIS